MVTAESYQRTQARQATRNLSSSVRRVNKAVSGFPVSGHSGKQHHLVSFLDVRPKRGRSRLCWGKKEAAQAAEHSLSF